MRHRTQRIRFLHLGFVIDLSFVIRARAFSEHPGHSRTELMGISEIEGKARRVAASEREVSEFQIRG
jgi:hypothetical protein